MSYERVKRVVRYLPATFLGFLVGAGTVYIASERPMMLEMRWGKEEKYFTVDSRTTPNLCSAMKETSFS